MTTAQKLIQEATRRGILLAPHGPSQLAVYSNAPVDPNFEKILRRHKPALLRLLRQKRHLARQVLQNEFDGCPGSTFQSLTESLLENQFDPQCWAALQHMTQTRLGHPHPR